MFLFFFFFQIVFILISIEKMILFGKIIYCCTFHIDLVFIQSFSKPYILYYYYYLGCFAACSRKYSIIFIQPKIRLKKKRWISLAGKERRQYYIAKSSLYMLFSLISRFFFSYIIKVYILQHTYIAHYVLAYLKLYIYSLIAYILWVYKFTKVL